MPTPFRQCQLLPIAKPNHIKQTFSQQQHNVILFFRFTISFTITFLLFILDVYKNLLFILDVYLLSSNSKLEKSQDYFDYLWALYNSLSARGHVLILSDLNGDLGNSVGDKGNYESNQCGLKLLDLVDCFKLWMNIVQDEWDWSISWSFEGI